MPEFPCCWADVYNFSSQWCTVHTSFMWAPFISRSKYSKLILCHPIVHNIHRQSN